MVLWIQRTSSLGPESYFKMTHGISLIHKYIVPRSGDVSGPFSKIDIFGVTQSVQVFHLTKTISPNSFINMLLFINVCRNQNDLYCYGCNRKYYHLQWTYRFDYRWIMTEPNMLRRKVLLSFEVMVYKYYTVYRKVRKTSTPFPEGK